MNTTASQMAPLTIAEYFIEKSNKEGRPITNKKLQKLLYYSQAWSLVLRDKKLFDEKIEAWVHGPAIKSVYVEYKKFGFNPIKKEANSTLLKTISSEEQKLLDNVWSVYGKLDADYLEMLTHSESPWLDARQGLQSSESSENEISIDSMQSFYSEKLNSGR